MTTSSAAAAATLALAAGIPGAAWASSPTTPVSVTSTDGGAKLTGTITWTGYGSYTARWDVEDVAKDGKGPSVTIWSNKDFGMLFPHQDAYEHDTLGYGSGIGFPSSRQEPIPLQNLSDVTVILCNSPGKNCKTKPYSNPLDGD